MNVSGWIEMGKMDELGRLDTPAHRLDARVKAAVTIVFVAVVMSFPRREVSALTPFLLYPVSLAALGRVPAGLILKKALVAAPFALAVGIVSPFLDREPVASAGPLVITGGLATLASIMFRFALTVGAALVLVACTGMHRLAAGLERLGVPSVFAVQLLFLYRYCFVVGDEGLRMTRSVRMRADPRRPLGWRTYRALLGNLLLRSIDRAQRVYRAMLARCFDGEMRVMRKTAPGWGDAAFAGGWVAFFAVARTWNLARLLGSLVSGGGS